MIVAFAILQIAAASTGNWISDHQACVKTNTVAFEKSGEPATTVADAVLSKCENIWLSYKRASLENRPANAMLTYREAKKFLEDFYATVERDARARAIQTVVEIRAKSASN